MQLPVDNNPLKEGFIFIPLGSYSYNAAYLAKRPDALGRENIGVFAKLSTKEKYGFSFVTYEEYYFHPIGRI